MNKELRFLSHIYQTKPKQPINQPTNQSTKEVTEGRELHKSASRLPSACFAIPALTASLGSVTDTLTFGTMHPIYIEQKYRYSPEYAFYIFSQEIYLIIFLDFLSPSSFIPPPNVVYFLMLHFFVHKIFTFYINGVLNCKCPALGPKG